MIQKTHTWLNIDFRHEDGTCLQFTKIKEKNTGYVLVILQYVELKH